MSAAAINSAIADTFDVAKVRFNESPLEYSSGNIVNTKITLDQPIKELHCRLTGSLTIGTANDVTKTHGILNLLKRVTLRLNNNQPLFDCPGFALPTICKVYDRSAPLVTQPAFTYSTSPNAFEVFFKIPVNYLPGSYASLLDASGQNSLILEVLWGAVNDVSTVGSGGSHSITSGCKLYVDTIAVSGKKPGMAGGVRFPYPFHKILHRQITIPATNPTFQIDLLKRHAYPQVIIYTVSDAEPVDTVLNKVFVKIGNNVLQPIDAAMLKLENVSRFNLGSKITGCYIVDFADVGRLEEMLAVAGTLSFQLVLDVTKVGTTDVLYVIEDTLSQASGQG